jgi:hypothetical protein
LATANAAIDSSVAPSSPCSATWAES